MVSFPSFENLDLIYPLYFFYGLAFLFLGASIGIKDMKGSHLKIAGNLWMISVFGFTHGTHEWIQLFLIVQKKLFGIENMISIQIASYVIVLISFLFLLLFSFSLLNKMNEKKIYQWLQIISVFFFFVLLFYVGQHDFHKDPSLFNKVDVISRISFGFLGSFLTGLAFFLYAVQVSKKIRFISLYFFLTALGFFLYSLFAGMMFAHHKPAFLPLPIEFFRGLCAVMITYFLMKGLNIFDIETRSKLERQVREMAQSEKMATLGQLAAGIAHEINTPLTNASLNIQMLINRPEKYLVQPERMEKKLQSIERNIDRASSIAKELLRFSHIRETDYETQDINQIILDALSVLEYRLKHIRVKKKFGDVPLIQCDPDKIEQVIINVVNNSIEAMKDNKEITILTQALSNNVIIEITDNGAGIPDEYISKAFDPFFTTKKIGQGSGLGLSICFSIIEQHDGSINFSRHDTKGTTIIIKLPINRDK